MGAVAPDKAVPALAKLLSDPDLDVRMATATTLGHYGPAAKAAVPALIVDVSRGDAEVRVAAIGLEAMGKEALPAVKFLSDSLNNSDKRVRQASAEVLGKLGEGAAQAEAPLRRVLNDEDPEVRKAASDALLSILASPKEEK